MYVRQKPAVDDRYRLVDFLHKQMIKLELCQDENVIVSCEREAKFWVLRMASADLAEKIVYLNGIRLALTTVFIYRHSQYKGRPSKFSYNEFLYDRISKIKVILTQNPPICSYGTALMEFLNERMKKLELCKHNAICRVKGPRSRVPGQWTLDALTEDVADKLCYLNKINFKNSTIMLKRHHEYTGSPPKFTVFQNFMKDRYPKIQVILRQQPPTNDCVSLLAFINATMKQFGLCEENSVDCWEESGPGEWTLDAASEATAEKLCYLHLISLENSTIMLKRHYDYKGPAPKFSTYNDFVKDYSSKIKVILIQEPPISDGPSLQKILNATMKKFGLCEQDAVAHCEESGLGKWMLVAGSEVIAEKLCYLNHLSLHSWTITLERHSTYKGPAPKFCNFQSFSQHYDNNKTPKISHALNNKLVEDGLTRDAHTSSISDAVINQTSPTVHVSNNALNYRPTQPADDNADTNGPESQANIHLQEITRLKRELLTLTRELVSTKQQFGEVTEQYEELKATKEMEEGFIQASGTCKDAEAKLAMTVEELTAANQALALVAEKEKSNMQGELLGLSSQLVMTQQQLADVHKSWQEQQQQIIDLQAESGEAKAKLEGTERRYRDVTESLSIQTNELAKERRYKRELEETLNAERKEMEEEKKKWSNNQQVYVKPESAPDV